MNVLVTGAAGFMGSHVAEECLKSGMRVVAVDNLSGGFLENVPSGCIWEQGDLENPEFCKSLFASYGSFDAIYHLAAYAAEGLSHFIRCYNYRNNLIASMNLLNEAIISSTPHFVFTSSIAVYGAGQTPMLETTTPLPEDPYGIAKYAVELDLRAAHEMFGINYTIFRPHNVYGPRQNIADKYRNVIGIFMNHAMRGLPMPIFGDGNQTRAFSYIGDVAPLIAVAPFTPNAKNETFNIGADTPYTVLELAKAVADIMGLPNTVVHLPPRKEVIHAFASHDKARAAFGSRPMPVTLWQGLDSMSKWVLQQGSSTPVSFKNVEVRQGLPDVWL